MARRMVVAALGLALLAGGSGGARAGVKFGDAVPGIIKKTDLTRIKRQLELEHFSVVAAVQLGATDGREVIIVEPLNDEALAKVTASCKSGPFCPDRLGFVGSRIRVILLQNNDVRTILTINQEARSDHGRLLDMKEIKDRGAWFAWGGWAESEAGHVALSLMPIVEGTDGLLRGANDEPIRFQWNERIGRFQYLRCAEAESETPTCKFADEVGG